MSITNEIWLTVDGHRTRLDTDESTLLLPTFQANDRTSPSTLENDYSPEFSVPATAKNHRLLRHAAASQNVAGIAYTRVPCVLTSGGIETLPLALLYIKGYEGGRYNLQITGGNRRLTDALKNPDGSDKKLSDLDLNRFNHIWKPTEILPRLSPDYFRQNGYGYELYERGKPLDLQAIDPYDLYPSCSAELIWRQLLADAGFTADSLRGEPFWAALTLPSANPFTFSSDYRDARMLQAGQVVAYDPTVPNRLPGIAHQEEFAQEKLTFTYTQRKPYHAPTAGATYTAGVYVADTLGYYNLSASVALRFGCREDLFGQVSCKVLLHVNGKPVQDTQGNEIGKDEFRIRDKSGYITRTFSPKLERYLLYPGDKIELFWQGDEWPNEVFGGPVDPYWQIGPGRDINYTPLLGKQILLTDSVFKVELLPDFPIGGLVRLQDWLPDMKQIDFAKGAMVFLGLTVMTDSYEPHLKLSPGTRLLENLSNGLVRNWTAKRDAYAQPGRQPERALQFRFGDYGKVNKLLYEPDDNVTAGYGDGTILVKDEVLPDSYELAKLPFAATEGSPVVPGMLRILNFESSDLTAKPPTYSTVTAKPRITLKTLDSTISGQLIMVPATDQAAAQLQPFSTNLSFFAGPTISLLLDETCLTQYWSDLRAMLDEARYLVENYRLTAQDIAELDFSIPLYDKGLNDFFAISKIAEFDSRRPVQVTLVRLNPTHLPPPTLPEGVVGEFFAGEFSHSPREFY
jgi:hypothetical protein